MPTLYKTGQDDAGRSAVLDRISFETGVPQLHVVADPPRVEPCSSTAVLLDHSDIEPGTALWAVVSWEPGEYTDLHRTHSLDFDIVMTGSIDLELETETLTLRPGDCIYLPGTVHAWHCREEPAMLTYAIVTTPAPAGDENAIKVPGSSVRHSH